MNVWKKIEGSNPNFEKIKWLLHRPLESYFFCLTLRKDHGVSNGITRILFLNTKISLKDFFTKLKIYQKTQ